MGTCESSIFKREDLKLDHISSMLLDKVKVWRKSLEKDLASCNIELRLALFQSLMECLVGFFLGRESRISDSTAS